MLFLWGLLIFLLGLEGSKWGLKKAVSQKIEEMIKNLSGNVFYCIILGVLITGLIQSSSAVSVIIISLIETRMLSLKPSLAIIMGANIGTTLTVQIISMPILELYPQLIILGGLLVIIGLFHNRKIFYTGISVVSFGVIFAGLVTMTEFFKAPVVISLIRNTLMYTSDNYLFGIIIGMFITGIIQSSSAVTGITVSLARSGIINLTSAIAIAMGSNIGTCITAFIASLNCSKVSKMMATGHFIFNLVGVLAVLPFYSVFCKLVEHTSDHLIRQIANAHTIFNVFNVLLFVPFIGFFTDILGGDKYGTS